MVAAESSDVCHSCIHIKRPHRVSHRFILFQHRFVILGVFAVQFPVSGVSPFIQEEFCQLKVFFISGNAVEFCQADFNHLVPGHPLFFTGSEYRFHQVGIFNCQVQHITLASGQVMGSGCFIEMAHVVKFMAHIEIGPTRSLTPENRGVRVYSPGGIKIPIRFLGRGDFFYQFIQVLVQPGIGAYLQRVGCPFHDLIHITVVKRIFALKGSFFQFPGHGKVLDAPGFLAHFECIRDSDFLICLQPVPPKMVRHSNLSKGNRLNGIIFFYRGSISAGCH